MEGPFPGTCTRSGTGTPPIGQVDAMQFLILAGILSRHTSTAADVFFGFWEGNGRINAADGSFFPEMKPARFRLGGRQQIAVRGNLSAVVRAHRAAWPNPNAMWPADRSWYLATEIDSNSTIVAGDESLIAGLLAHPELEALRAFVDLDLTCFVDTIN